jgi:IS5 family transposase
MKRQKDEDARWTKKYGKSHYGDKNHVNVDQGHKLIRRYAVTDASVHDCQVFDDILDDENADRSIWADAAYRHAARGTRHARKSFGHGATRAGFTRRAIAGGN